MHADHYSVLGRLRGDRAKDGALGYLDPTSVITGLCPGAALADEPVHVLKFVTSGSKESV